MKIKNLFLNKKKLTLVLSLVFCAVVLGVGASAAVNGGLPGLAAISMAVSQSSGETSQTSAEPSEPESSESAPETSSEPSEPVEAQPVVYSKPERMMAVTLTPGVDYYTDPSLSDADIKASIDKAVDSAVKLTANTVILATKYNDTVLYRSSDMPQTEVTFDILNYAIAKARSKDLYVYVTYDVLLTNKDGKAAMSTAIDRDVLKTISENVKQLVENYDIDAVMLDNYTVARDSGTYSEYSADGNGMGYENYLRASTQAAVNAAYTAAKAADPSVQAGLAVDAVWANSTTVDEGSETASSYESMVDGCADTRKFVDSGLADFVAVKSDKSINNKDASFAAYMGWWADEVDGKIPLYALQYASKACTADTGWSKPSELSDQIIAAEKLKGFSGSMFDSLAALLNNPQQSTDALVLYLTENEDPSFLLTQLEMTRPGQLTYSTYETSVQFVGASDGAFPLYMNGEEVTRDQNGAFFLNINLEPGLNTFKFEHKEKTITYNITRNVQIIKEISPMGNVSIAGGMQITVTAVAYEGSTLTATLAGQTVTLKQSTEADDETDNDSTYKQFSGTLTVPAATTSDQSLGNIVVNGKWSSASPESMTGAYVTVKAKSVSGDLVEIVTNSAETFPTTTLDDLSDYDCYPLAKGTRDYTDGDEIVYKNGDKTYTYFNLQSGQRVYSSDIASVSGSDLGGNKINGITVSANARYTKVIIDMDQPVAYVARYSADAFTIDFKYTSAVPENMSLSCTPLFSAATWNGTKLTLSLSTPAGFLGYYAYYDGGDLVFRFNNPQGTSSLSGIPIVIDVGHSASKPGAMGFLSAYGEYEINYAVGVKLYYELQDRGATVYMQDTQGSSPDLAQRVAYANSANPMVFVSLHCNSSTTSTGSGTEGWYFTRFSAGLARRFAANVASALGTENRGDKIGRYYVTRVAEFSAILGEMGFVSNEDDYYKLVQNSYQSSIASGVADAISAYLGAVGANGSYDYGTQTSGSASTVPDDPNTEVSSSKPSESSVSESSSGSSSSSSSSSQSSSASGKETDLGLPETLELEVGEVYRFDTGMNYDLTWESSDTSVATVKSSGKVTARQKGTVTITATDEKGNKDTCVITVG